MKAQTRKVIIKVITTVVMAVLSIAMITPFLWMLSASFKPDNQIFDFPIKWIPNPITWANYDRVWNSDVPFLTFFFNSCAVSLR